MYKGSRPEESAPAELYYNEEEAKKYHQRFVLLFLTKDNSIQPLFCIVVLVLDPFNGKCLNVPLSSWLSRKEINRIYSTLAADRGFQEKF